MTDLIPCPFCGGEAARVDIEDGENAGGSCVYCKKCNASGNLEFEFKENLSAAWNTRTPTPAPNAGAVKIKPGEIERAVWSAMIWAADNNVGFNDAPEYTDMGNSFAEDEARRTAARILSAIEPTPDPRDAVIARLVEVVGALGAMPEGYCFCSAHRIGDDSKVHEPECSDLRAALAAAKEVME